MADQRRKSRGSLAGNLVVLVGAVALPLMILGASGLWLQYRSGRDIAEAQLVEQARATSLLVDREIERTVSVARTLAEAVPVARGDLDAVDGELRAARDMLAATLPPGAPPPVVSLVDADGYWLLHTAWAPGERRTGLRVTAVARAAIAERQPQVSDLFIGPSTHTPVVGVAAPIFGPPTGPDMYRAVTGSIGMSVPRERLIAIVQEAGLAPGTIISVLDRKGVIAASSDHDAETVGTSPPAAILDAMSAARAGIVHPTTRTADGVSTTIAFARAPYSDFVLKIDIPDEVFLGPLRRSLYRSAGFGLLVCVVGLALALISARGIVRAFQRALDIANGGETVPRATEFGGLREADDLAEMIATAMAEREKAAGNARALLDNSPIGIIIFSLDGWVREANDAFLSMLGRTRPEVVTGGFKWNEMTPPQWIERDEAAFSEVLVSGRCTPYEKEYRRADGALVPVLISSGLTDSEHGLAAAFVMDLTEQRRIEEARREAEDRLHFSLAAGRLGAWDLDLATQTIRCSDIGQALYGRVLDHDVAFQDLLQVVHRDDRGHLQETVDQAIADGSDFRTEYRVLWPDRTIHWLEVRGKVLPHAGKPARLAGVSADISDRKQAEAALRDSETRLRAITDTMPQIVWSARADGYHDYYNQRWYDLTGRTPTEAEGEGWDPVCHPDDEDRAATRWHHSLATGDPYESEYRLRMADGTYRWMLGRALPIRDQQTNEIVRWFGTCTDIEDTVAARETLARSREELEQIIAERTQDLQATQVKLAQAQRMEALGKLAGGMAHDFNNVLQAVQGSSALIDRKPADVYAVRRNARIILEATERGAAITRRLLAFSRRGDLHAEPVDPIALQASLCDILSHTLGDGVIVRIEQEPDLPPLLADKGQLETVLVNLATNGRDAMSGIGVLTLAAAAETVHPDQVPDHRAALKAGAYVRLSVSDTGVGMDAETVARASEPFWTTKPVGRGTGLGLAMANGFAEQSGGGLHISSSPGRGTTVTLWLPVAEDGLPDTPECPEPVASIACHGRVPRLLLVDDDDIVRDVTAEVMEATGFIVLRAASAAAAISLLDANADVDILVSDLSMPDMDGVQLIHEAQRRRPGLPAILLTGFATLAAELAVDGSAGGEFSLLRKPIQGKHLAERATALLEAASLCG